MLSLLEPSASVNRREMLRVGGLGAFGLTLPQLLAASETTRKKPKSCIILFLLGAPPQHDTWDPKPDAPPEIRGDLGVIRTATPGLIVGETMPKTAAMTDKIAVLRAVQTDDNAHSSSGYYMTTGVPHVPVGVENAKPGFPNDYPALGVVVRKLFGNRSALPAAVTLPEAAANDGNLLWPGQDAGFLGRAHDPWLLPCDPSEAKFRIPGLSLPEEVPPLRFDDRRNLLAHADAHFDRIEKAGLPGLYTDRGRKAFELIASPLARKAFDIETEDPKTRDRYGRHRFGQSCLLARRLVESGVPLVRVNWTRVPDAPNNGHWDTHSKNSEAMKRLMPMLDQTYTALLTDLADRGLLDDTLVIWTGEFGRTPKINGAGGRDHWGKVFSVALAGGGVKGGTVYGASDKIAAFPKDGLVRPQDLLATVYHTLGIPTDSEIHDSQGRPLAITRGEVVKQIL